MENSSSLQRARSVPPMPFSPQEAAVGLQKWLEKASQCTDSALAGWMRESAQPQHASHALLLAALGNSPYLSRLLLQFPQVLHACALHGADKVWEELLAALATPPPAGNDHQDLMRHLRQCKGQAALLTALADLSEAWQLPQVTQALTTLAENSLALSVDAILQLAHRRGEIELKHPHAPSPDSGIIILGMGKLGGRELNYSSDIDLIVLFEPGRIAFKGRISEAKFMTRLAHDIVTLMQERTPHGYVFRTDLRLRPDPASTPPAISIEAAYYYYESVGQNWERAAMIKARPVAGDMEAGERFLKRLTPFMWRRNLDFAAINDIHSIKRQMDSHRSKALQLAGHNIKLGQGGIREIEFYTQIHQLIWGGREPVLRTRPTCETLASLSEYGLVEDEKRRLLQSAYGYFRVLEHRLQMVDDAQTHSIPQDPESIARIACFMGYGSVADFEAELMPMLAAVHDIYASSFKSEGHGLGDVGNLVFTGVSDDPDTLETLRSMGYQHPKTVSEIVMGWHHGSCRATRTRRARELLTELMPLLLKRLSETASPDVAFLKFNEFLANLPSGVPLFSLFNANTHLIGLIADIMGSAPTLADSLSKSPELLDAVLYDDFYAALPSPAQLAGQLDSYLKDSGDLESSIEDAMDRIRYFRNEKQFQAGVQLLRGLCSSQKASLFLSQLADITINKTFHLVHAEFARSYGAIEGSGFAAIALGKLGSREMSFGSDIDLVFVYEAEDFDRTSDGEKEYTPSVYFNRLAQRFVGALSAMGRAGRLYEVDTRLRPSGRQGLLAVSTNAIANYFDELAWTFEYMAFTKARTIIGSDSLRRKLDGFIRRQLAKPRDADKLRPDVCDMRERVARSHATANPWDIKHVRGGLMDIDFLAQYLLLLHAPDCEGASPGSAAEALGWLKQQRRMPEADANALLQTYEFLSCIFNMLRLCSDGQLDESTAPDGLKRLLVQSVAEAGFDSLKRRLIHVERTVLAYYSSYLKT